MEIPKFKEIVPNIGLLETPFGEVWSGVYLVRGEKTFLIDSGATAETARDVIVPALAQTGLKPTDIDLLLCTHTHGDHVGGHAFLKGLGVRCGATPLQAEKLADPLKYSKLIRSAFPEDSPAPPPVLTGVRADVIVEPDGIIGNWKVIPTPGHDSDCVGFLDRETGTLLCGDSLQWNGTVAQGCALYMDLPGYRESIRRLMKEPIERIVPGHAYLPFDGKRIEGGKMVRNALEQALELIGFYDKVIGRFRDLPPREITKRLIEEVGGKRPEYLFPGLYTVREHLKQCETPTP